MGKDNLTITMDKLNAIIPIFAAEFCDMNDGEGEDLIMGAAAYIFVNVEKYIRGERDVDEKVLGFSTLVLQLVQGLPL